MLHGMVVKVLHDLKRALCIANINACVSLLRGVV